MFSTLRSRASDQFAKNNPFTWSVDSSTILSSSLSWFDTMAQPYNELTKKFVVCYVPLLFLCVASFGILLMTFRTSAINWWNSYKRYQLMKSHKPLRQISIVRTHHSWNYPVASLFFQVSVLLFDYPEIPFNKCLLKATCEFRSSIKFIIFIPLFQCDDL